MMDLRNYGPRSVRLETLRRYLAATGWIVRATSKTQTAIPDNAATRVLLGERFGGRRNFEVYVSTDRDLEGVELIVPNNKDSLEYAKQVHRVINALAAIEDCTAENILKSIREISFDVIRSRIPDSLVLDDTIHLDVARNYISGIRDVLASTATTELNPLPYFSRNKKEANEYADRCHFAHTFRGSFGFTVASPIQPNNQYVLDGLAPPPPFERRVIERLTRGLSSVCKAVSVDSTEPIIESTKTGFSANVCEHFAKLGEETSESGMIFDFSFSPEWKGEKSMPLPGQNFVLARQHFEVIRAAARELRAQLPSRPETIFGRVTRLATDANPSDLTDLIGEREVAIFWSSETEGDITVKASLTPADYLRAVRAHADGRPVEVSGILERRPRGWMLLDPTNLIVHG